MPFQNTFRINKFFWNQSSRILHLGRKQVNLLKKKKKICAGENVDAHQEWSIKICFLSFRNKRNPSEKSFFQVKISQNKLISSIFYSFVSKSDFFTTRPDPNTFETTNNYLSEVHLKRLISSQLKTHKLFCRRDLMHAFSVHLKSSAFHPIKRFLLFHVSICDCHFIMKI